jgi:DNA end-binding protein Ku
MQRMPRKSASEDHEKESGGGPGARPIWSGAISFGLVNIPINLFSMEKRSADISFKMLDGRNNAPVRYQRVNEETGEEVPWDQIVKGYEYTKGEYVVMKDEDLKNFAAEATQMIEIESFIDETEIEDFFFDKPYIVAPGKRAEKGYVLLREIMKRTGKVGIARIVIRTREYLAAVMPKDNAILIMLLRYDHELRKPSEFKLPSEDFEMTEKELKLGEQLLEAMTEKFDIKDYKDEHRDKLLAFIEELADKGTVSRPTEGEKPAAAAGKVIDLAELLAKSLPKKGEKAG